MGVPLRPSSFSHVAQVSEFTKEVIIEGSDLGSFPVVGQIKLVLNLTLYHQTPSQNWTVCAPSRLSGRRKSMRCARSWLPRISAPMLETPKFPGLVFIILFFILIC